MVALFPEFTYLFMHKLLLKNYYVTGPVVSTEMYKVYSYLVSSVTVKCIIHWLYHFTNKFQDDKRLT
jgi:hypothetical protein